MNEAVDEAPTTREAYDYLERNRILVHREAQRLHEDPQLSKALSYLYAAQILEISAETRRHDHPRSDELLERAVKLGVYLPNTYDICGTGNALDAVLAIAEFAGSFAAAMIPNSR